MLQIKNINIPSTGSGPGPGKGNAWIALGLSLSWLALLFAYNYLFELYLSPFILLFAVLLASFFAHYLMKKRMRLFWALLLGALF
jgi:hypothetical protein